MGGVRFKNGWFFKKGMFIWEKGFIEVYGVFMIIYCDGKMENNGFFFINVT